MKSAFNRPILALTTILAVATTAPVAAQDKGLKKYEFRQQGVLDPSAG